MVGINKRQKQLKRLRRTVAALSRRRQRKQKRWVDELHNMNLLSSVLCNKSGKTRSVEENKLILLSLKGFLKRELEKLSEKKEINCDLSWSKLESMVSNELHVRREHVTALRKMFLEEGDIDVIETNKRGFGVGSSSCNNIKITTDVYNSISSFVYSMHATGKTVTARKILKHLQDEHNIKVHRRTIGRILQRLGLTWAPIKAKPRTFAAHRHENLRNFLIKLDSYVKEMERGNERGLVFVFTDESYIHQNHRGECSYLTADEKNNGMDRKRSKGRRLIILHAISPDGPLAERDENGYPVSDIVWTRDTPHPNKNEKSKLTCETLWLAESHSGDYHDNMNSEMFLKWIQESLFPTFEKLYPNKKMVLLCDNAPYHHKRKIGSLASMSKKKLLEMMQKYNVEYLDLPLSNDERLQLANNEEDGVEDRGEFVRVPFFLEEQQQRASATKPRIANLDELKIAFVTYLKENSPEALECIVENVFREKGYDILWTPPYSPDLQPIEKYWGAGKNHAALYYTEGQKMKETVRLLREGWYGTGGKYPVGDMRRKNEVNCKALWMNSLKLATTKFVPICKGIDGTIGNLIIDENYVPEQVSVPIDTLILDLTKVGNVDDDIAVNDEVAMI